MGRVPYDKYSKERNDDTSFKSHILAKLYQKPNCR